MPTWHHCKHTDLTMIASLQSHFVTGQVTRSLKKHVFSSEQTCWFPNFRKKIWTGSKGFQSRELETLSATILSGNKRPEFLYQQLYLLPQKDGKDDNTVK